MKVKGEMFPQNYPLLIGFFQSTKMKANFNDRFSVQLSKYPANTITSHISKRTLFYSSDPMQCRSLTVREAARIKLFRTIISFVSRTSQYVQVGFAAAFLARQMAAVVYEWAKRASLVG